MARLTAAGLMLLACACRSRPEAATPAPAVTATTPAPRAATADRPGASAATGPAAAPAAPVDVGLRFADVTDEAGVTFTHESGARGAKWLPEAMGSGVAVFDADADGRQDLYFVNFRAWPADRRGAEPAGALYLNRGGWRFEDVTRAWGLAEPLAGMGATAADFDADGDQDLFVACVGQDRLYRNEGGRFSDATPLLGGVAESDFGSSAAWLDAEGDGDLDLLVGNYVTWTPETDIHCTLDGVSKSYCTPESYPGASPRLWLNGLAGTGTATFTDGTREAGLEEPSAKTLGVVVADLDGDAKPDVVLANDTQPNMLFRNVSDAAAGAARFVEEGVVAGIAYDENGATRGAMGIDAGDANGDGRLDLVIGNFSNEMSSLYENASRGGRSLFVDVAPASEIGRQSLLTLAFGCVFLDADLDGHEDVFVANGHLDPEIERVQSRVRFAQPPHLFRNRGDGRFDDVATLAGAGLAAPRVARAAAAGDLDGDGDLDLVVTVNGGRARVFRNDLGTAGTTSTARHWLRVVPRGTDANRDAIGASVVLEAGGRRQVKVVKAGSSYLAQSQLAPTFGLGDATTVTALEITWPSGRTSRHEVPGVDRELEIVEPPEAPQ